MVHARRYEPMTTSDFSGPLPNCGPLSNGSAVNGPWTEVWGSSNGRILQSCVNMQPQKYSLWQLWAGPGRVAYPAVGKKWFQKKIQCKDVEKVPWRMVKSRLQKSLISDRLSLEPPTHFVLLSTLRATMPDVTCFLLLLLLLLRNATAWVH